MTSPTEFLSPEQEHLSQLPIARLGLTDTQDAGAIVSRHLSSRLVPAV